MRSIFLYFLRVLLLSLGMIIHLSGYAASGSNLFEASKFWPEKVTVSAEITGVKHGNVVKPGKEWVFLRYQDGKCLVDMGHNGIQALDVEDTDILERMTKISEERTFPFQGLFTYRYTKSFYDPKTLRGLQLGDLDPYDYFVLFYFDYESSIDVTKTLKEFIQKYANELNTEMKVEVLLLPGGNIIASARWPWVRRCCPSCTGVSASCAWALPGSWRGRRGRATLRVPSWYLFVRPSSRS